MPNTHHCGKKSQCRIMKKIVTIPVCRDDVGHVTVRVVLLLSSPKKKGREREGRDNRGRRKRESKRKIKRVRDRESI